MILCIETATSICSVALCDKDKIIGLKESAVDKSHASLLTVFIEELLNEQNVSTEALDAIVVSKGPGSYTGLRIGVSVAKGLCYGATIPLIAINTLESMFYGAVEKYYSDSQIDTKMLLCPMIDARRMEVYSSLFDSGGKEKIPVKAELINEDSYSEYLKKGPILFFGNGSDKFEEIISHPNAIFKSDYKLTASSLIKPANEAFENKRFENLAYFEPYYLKDFIATVSKKNLLGR